MRRLLIVGFGDVARRAMPLLRQRYRVFALVRDAGSAAAARALGATPLSGDLDRPETLARAAALAGDVLHCAPPAMRGAHDDRSRRLVAALARHRSLPQRLVYISTTGVYGDCGGVRIDETRRVAPASDRARRRVDAERVLRAYGRRSGACVSILRAPGIYAADRLPVERLRARTPAIVAEQDGYTNHIHADDLAAACGAALARGAPGRAYHASDDSQLRMGDYFDRVADRLGLARPPRLAREAVASAVPPMLWSFMAESRRLCNRRLKRELRLRLRYPTVDATLAALPTAARGTP
jgi:nucleoside-diphosphate-sugar epimerase